MILKKKLMLRSNSKPIGITLGDPGGIGPEIIQKALGHIRSNVVIIGDKVALPKLPSRKNIQFINLSLLEDRVVRGKPTVTNAKASMAYLDKAIELLKNRTIRALVTAPLCKESICEFKPKFQGHTEYLANAFKTKNVEMMFVGPNVRTIIATR